MSKVLHIGSGLVALLALLALGASSPSPEPAPSPSAAGKAQAERPHVLIVTLDTTRADHASAYGYRRPTTPRLEQLAREGTLFEAAYAPMATTLPSHATMFSGLLPRSHGTLKNGLVVDAKVPMLAQTLAARGYRTAAFLSSFALDSSFGLNRGFETYDDDFTGGQCRWEAKRWEGHRLEGEFCRRADLTRARVESWLERNGYLAGAGREGEEPPPFFVWMHIFDPHAPYDPLPEHAARFPPESAEPSELERSIAAYDAEIHFADQETGKLLDRLAAAGILDDTLVVVVGDHGEGLMDHGWMMHGLQLYEEAVRVPFIVRWPRAVPAGRRIAEPVELADLAPTITDLVGLGPFTSHRPLDGRSIAAPLRGAGELDAEHVVRMQRRFYASGTERGGIPVKGDKHAIRRGRWKYIEAKDEDSYELYDLTSDPGEKRNLAAEDGERKAELAKALHTWLATPAAGTTTQSMSPDAARRLEALGYVQ